MYGPDGFNPFAGDLDSLVSKNHLCYYGLQAMMVYNI
jgi:hypothetical protein